MADVWLNGAMIDEADAHVSLRDTGLLHAAGVFTTMRSYGGVVFNLDRHLRRLRDSCEALFIPLQQTDEQIREAAALLLQRNALRDARLRLTVTRGLAHHDPLHGMHLQPTVFLTAADLEPYPAEYYQQGLTVLVLDEQKLNPYDMQAGHKTLDYFSRLAALREATRRQAGEALWFNVHNYLQSGSISNVFLVERGRLVTPPTNVELRDRDLASRTPYAKSNVLPGVTRASVVEIAASSGIEVELSAIDIARLLDANEIFLTNSIMGIMPVCRVERRSVGEGKPGPITLTLSDEYARRVSE